MPLQDAEPPAEPLFSVIIPAYGRPQFLPQAIESVLRQSVSDLECIVVDDASPQPVEVPDDPRIRLVRRAENGGAAAARNSGVELAGGRYLAFLDDDDLYRPERLALGLEGINRAPLAVCWLAPAGRQADPRLLRHYARSENRILEGDVHDVILDGLPPHLGQITIGREDMLPFDTRFPSAEDIEWWIRATARHQVATVPKVGYLLRRHPSPRLNFQHEVRVRTNLLMLKEHADYFAAHPRGAARRWRSQAIFAGRMGDRATARAALWRSFRLHPRPSTLWRLARSLAP